MSRPMQARSAPTTASEAQCGRPESWPAWRRLSGGPPWLPGRSHSSSTLSCSPPPLRPRSCRPCSHCLTRQRPRKRAEMAHQTMSPPHPLPRALLLSAATTLRSLPRKDRTMTKTRPTSARRSRSRPALVWPRRPGTARLPQSLGRRQLLRLDCRLRSMTAASTAMRWRMPRKKRRMLRGSKPPAPRPGSVPWQSRPAPGPWRTPSFWSSLPRTRSWSRSSATMRTTWTPGCHRHSSPRTPRRCSRRAGPDRRGGWQ
mmetsp:Transcript_19006/g.72585  ORF Transcript_19006/g.72585 Transcript_19006/m.72585 type:complete len:257 (+) Transcript_19006:6611-7381(+)